MMLHRCPNQCYNKNQDGWCLSSVCINPQYSNYGTWQYEQMKPKPQTNADRIRAMSDEELAKWLAKIAHIECNPDLYGDCPHIDDLVFCDGCWLEWLRKEVSDGLQESDPKANS